MIALVCPFVFERVESIAEAIHLASNSKPHLITLRPLQSSKSQALFESVTITVAEELGEVIRKLEATVVHNITKYIDITTVELLKANVYFHYDYKDIFFGFVKHHDAELEIHKLVWLAMQQRNIPISYRDGRALMASSRLGYTRITGYFLPEFITIDQYKTLTRLTEPYVKNRRKTDIVFIGNFSLETINPEQAGHGQLAIAKALTNQQLTYTMYPKQTSGRTRADFREYYNLASERENFNYKDTLPRDELHSELPKFGWGSVLMPHCHFADLSDKTIFNPPIAGLPGRVTDYLGAGLPLLVSDNFMPELTDWVDLYGVGVIVQGSKINSLEEIIDKVDFASLRRNSVSFATQFLSPFEKGKTLMEAYERYKQS